MDTNRYIEQIRKEVEKVLEERKQCYLVKLEDGRTENSGRKKDSGDIKTMCDFDLYLLFNEFLYVDFFEAKEEMPFNIAYDDETEKKLILKDLYEKLSPLAKSIINFVLDLGDSNNPLHQGFFDILCGEKTCKTEIGHLKYIIRKAVERIYDKRKAKKAFNEIETFILNFNE